MKFDQRKNDSIKDEILSSNDLIPFIGAGFSININGYPTFRDFINKNIANRLCVYQKCELDHKLDLFEIFNDNPNEAIEYFIYTAGSIDNKEKQDIFKSGKEAFHKEVEKEFDKVARLLIHGNEDEWSQHLDLVNRFDQTIYTTNWDHAIEKAFEYNNRSYEKIYYDSKKIIRKPYQGNNETKTKIIKLHGDFTSCGSLVACDTDYYTRISKKNNVLDLQFMKDLKEKNILYIGYSLSDINIKYFINNTSGWKDSVPHNKNQHFLISVEDPEKIHEEKVRFFEEWVGIKIYFLCSDNMDEVEKTNAIREFIKIL